MKHRLMGAMLIAIACIVGKEATAQRDVRAVRDQAIKYQQLLQLIDAVYVDTVNVRQLTEAAIVKVLAELDPHSVYISKEEVEEANEPLEGGFYGIGIQFNILRDTLMVVDVIAGGPAEKVGMRAGDRIVVVDGEEVAGKGITASDVRKKLKGEKGTHVQVGVLRGREHIDFDIVRDMIPIHSVDAAYMIDSTIGYIKIARFAANTVQEFEEAVRKLQALGMQDLILDLQGNGGGYMEAAIRIADHLLDGEKLIVYTDGETARRLEASSTPEGLFQKGKVVVLLDGTSASASEIVAGAVQDWDRGLIVGRRSFGKGLVQRQFALADGSMVRLTVSHYYTPSGRCIQKPYKGQDYRAELYRRYISGELVNEDSIRLVDTTKYYTKSHGRLVYGGGGIMPDLFVPIDTNINYTYFNRLLAKNVINEYVMNYVDQNRDRLKQEYPTFADFRKRFKVTDVMVSQIVANGEKEGIKRDAKLLPPVVPEIKHFVKALVARDLWDMNELYQISNENNKVLNAAVKALRDGTYDRKMK